MLHGWHGVALASVPPQSWGGKLSSNPENLPKGSAEWQEAPKPSGVPVMAAAHVTPHSLLRVVALLVQKPCNCPSLLPAATTGPSRTPGFTEEKCRD